MASCRHCCHFNLLMNLRQTNSFFHANILLPTTSLSQFRQYPFYKVCSHRIRRLCTETKAPAVIPSSTNSNIDIGKSGNKIPATIEQHCKQWSWLLQREQEAIIYDVELSWWRGDEYQLRCKNVFGDTDIIRFDLDISENSTSKIRHMFKNFPIGTTIELRPSSRSSSDYPEQMKTIHGKIRKHFSHAIAVSVKRTQFNPAIINKIKGVQFDIRKSNQGKQQMYKRQIHFLKKRHIDWCTMPGFVALLDSFGFIAKNDDNREPEAELQKIVAECQTNFHFDESQQKALYAILDFNRPFVAVQGPAGSGKRLLLANYLHILNKQQKRVWVISSSSQQMYNLIGQYCQITSPNERNFTVLEPYNPILAAFLFDDERVKFDIEKRCHHYSADHHQLDPELIELYKYQKMIGMEMNATWEFLHNQGQNPDDNEVIKEAKERQHSLQNAAFQHRDELLKKSLEKSDEHRIVFANLNEKIAILKRIGIQFDVIVFDHAEKFAEYYCWRAALPMTSTIRVFADQQQPGKRMHSHFGRKFASEGNISLVDRLNRQNLALDANMEDKTSKNAVNFHLKRQYRSNPAIHEWPNRAFYKQMAAEPDQSVRDIHLDNLLLDAPIRMDRPFLPAAPTLITDPFVFVDLSKLEGGWEPWMLQPTTIPIPNGVQAFFNWGEAILATSHLDQLFRHTSLNQSDIAYIAPSRSHHIRLASLLHVMCPRDDDNNNLTRPVFPENFSSSDFRILYGYGSVRPIDVVLKSFVKTNNCVKYFALDLYLKLLAWQMTRTKRQFMLLAQREWLEHGSEKSRQLLDTFHEKGRVIGPNDLCPLKGREQFDAIMEACEHARMERKMMMDKNRRH